MMLVEMEKLNLWIKGKHLLKNIDFKIEAGEIVALVGESGSGKTLLTKVILEVLPESAKVEWKHFEKIPVIGAIFQNAFTSLNPTMQIENQFKHLYQSCYGNLDAWEDRVATLLEKVGFLGKEYLLKKYPHELSGGEQQRMAIVGALLRETKFLIADEVTTALDVETKQEIMHLFQSLQQEFGLAILFITHDISTLKNFAHRQYILYHGEFVEENHPYAKKLLEFSENIWRRER